MPLDRFSRNTILIGAIAMAVLAIAAAVPVSTAQTGNSGTIKVHDGPTADPASRNEPHVTGDFYIEGMNMAATEGTLNFFSWPPTGDRTLVLATTWTADGGEPANHFLAGPFTLPCGHYRVEAQNGMEEDDFPGGTKNKMFWVEDCDAPEPAPGPEPDEEFPCPTDLAVRANGDESIVVTWTPAPGSDGTNLYRAVGGADLEYVDTFGPGVGTYTDTDTVEGSAYTYQVAALYGDEESEDCALATATAIPNFPAAWAAGLAVALGAGAYLAIAVRRKA